MLLKYLYIKSQRKVIFKSRSNLGNFSDNEYIKVENKLWNRRKALPPRIIESSVRDKIGDDLIIKF